jgi:hypothetical protein
LPEVWSLMGKVELKIDWATHEAAKYAVTHWHYSKSMPPPPMVHIGAWENKQFIGVVLFSRGANNNMLKPFGLKATEGCELVRVALTDHRTPVTKIIRHSLTFLRKASPGLRLIVSFADPEHGHVGSIYQAGNWIFTGQNEESTEYIGPDGRRWHGRMVKKQGWTTVYGKRRKVLTPKECTPIKRAGKYRYLMPLDDEMRKQIEPLRKPYPKRPKQAMTGHQPEQRECNAHPDAPKQ